MPKNIQLLNALEEIFEIAAGSEEEGDIETVGEIAANVLGYEWPPEEEEDLVDEE